MTSPSRRALPSPVFAQLSQTLSAANERHHAVATSFAAASSRTWHAQKRAAKLHLAVNIVKAVNCPHSRVSHIPLPIVEQEVDSDSESDSESVSAYEPAPAVDTETQQPRGRSQKRRPALHLDIPRDVPTTTNNSAGLFTTISLESPGTGTDDSGNCSAVAEPAAVAAQGAFCGVLPWNAYAADPFHVAPGPLPVEIIICGSDDDTELGEDFELLYPVIDDDNNGEEEEAEPAQSSSSSPSQSSSATESSGPSTPEDVEMRSVSSTSSKRKHGEMEVVFDTRPMKRASWTRPQPRGRKLC
ncbi:hypothetical protein MKEN_00617000 [Mycena kentingensis (nom. inval.)]|nr:hypothetical protein MKEN_00617000 [Mycena kentingensis (nom. inval.)]